MVISSSRLNGNTHINNIERKSQIKYLDVHVAELFQLSFVFPLFQIHPAYVTITKDSSTREQSFRVFLMFSKCFYVTSGA